MSRLDLFILRMQAQRACIDEAAARTVQLRGPVLEIGLGNGRSYDHLRTRFPRSAIYVFDREVAAHPDCIPEARFLRLGDFRATVPAFLLERHAPAAFIHADVGSADRNASRRLAAELAPAWLELLAPGGYLACDQPIELDDLEHLPLPGAVVTDNYRFYRRQP